MCQSFLLYGIHSSFSPTQCEHNHVVEVSSSTDVSTPINAHPLIPANLPSLNSLLKVFPLCIRDLGNYCIVYVDLVNYFIVYVYLVNYVNICMLDS